MAWIKLVCLLALFLVNFTTSVASYNWTYIDGPLGPSNWYKQSAICNGNLQSPIDLKQSSITYNQSLGDIALTGFGAPKAGDTVVLKNNGHVLAVDYNHPHAANISGSGLPGTFTLLLVHFHWAGNSSEGSEHTVDGEAFPAEVHYVLYNTKYVGNLSKAAEAKDGMAVLGVLFKISSSDNTALDPILNYAANVTTSGANTTIPSFNLRSLLPSDLSEFYRYNGSFTSPGCQESVTWTMFKDVITISEKQLNIFRSLKKPDGKPLLKAYRPVQSTNGRKILATFAAPAKVIPTTSVNPKSGSEALKSAAIISIFLALTSLALHY